MVGGDDWILFCISFPLTEGCRGARVDAAGVRVDATGMR